jgi:eukaryotic-like serine/threonine-protein kinase
MLTQIQTRDYKLISILGKGGFGTTYLAEKCDGFGGKYAIKKFTFSSQNQNNFEKAKELFLREGSALQELSSYQHIPKFYGYYEENQELYLVQEFIEGKTLTDEIGKFNEKQLINLLDKILEILMFIHDKNVIHRDIKPDNIMRRNNGELVLIDFGSVKIINLENCPHKPDTEIYTLVYAPPEQIKGKVQFNSDIYALGITAIQCLTNQLLTDKKEVIDHLEQLKVSSWLQQILIKMIDLDYTQRYQSAEQVLNDLKTPPDNEEEQETQVITPSVNSSDRFNNVWEIIISGLLMILVLSLFLILFLRVYGVIPDKKYPQRPQKQSLLINHIPPN